MPPTPPRLPSQQHPPPTTSQHHFSVAPNDAAAPSLPPVRRLELSVDPIDGSLLTAPLESVLLSVTDALYRDLFDMAHGELNVVIPSVVGGGGGVGGTDHPESSSSLVAGAALPTTTKRERMANLSFAQRRHELQWRLHRHGRALQHAAALAAAHALSSDPHQGNGGLASSVTLASEALQHARAAWMHADEAQDALYFAHAQLFPTRSAPHDAHGASDVLLCRTTPGWHDLPRDIRLDPPEMARHGLEASRTKSELAARWRTAVRAKLVTGEVGYAAKEGSVVEEADKNESVVASGPRRRRRRRPPAPLWSLSLRGGVLRLSHEASTPQPHPQPEQQHKKQQPPILALLTVLDDPAPPQAPAPAADETASSSSPSTRPPPPWTLLSLEVEVRAKAGEFHHQLRAAPRQRYDLHRLAARAMAVEEQRWRRKLREEDAKPRGEQPSSHVLASELSAKCPPSRPLQALFGVAHTFLLSWQLELLSAQAQALRRGVWALGGGGWRGVAAGGGAGSGNAATAASIHVTPVQFFADHQQQPQRPGQPLGVVSISFWKVDDSYGTPTMGYLSLCSPDGDESNDDHGGDDNGDMDHGSPEVPRQAAMPHSYNGGATPPTNQLTLTLRATANLGIVASLSGFRAGERLGGGSPAQDDDYDPADRAAVEEIGRATGNPLALSASDALLAATRWCADKKCHAVAEALQHQAHVPLPPWITLSVERGSIAVAVQVRYHGIPLDNHSEERGGGRPTLFRLLCDARTGSFVVCFPRQCHLLRGLACNALEASEPVSLRLASLPPNRRRAAGATSSGRVVRDAFEGLVRSLNLLGQRTGVGGSWDNLDDKSSLLRGRAIQSACADVRQSLVKSCGMAALFGLASVALGTALGLDPVPDMYV